MRRSDSPKTFFRRGPHGRTSRIADLGKCSARLHIVEPEGTHNSVSVKGESITSAEELVMTVVPPFATRADSLSKHPLSFLACWFVVTFLVGCFPAFAEQLSTPDQSTLPSGGSAVLPVPQPQFRGVI